MVQGFCGSILKALGARDYKPQSLVDFTFLLWVREEGLSLLAVYA